MQLPLDVLILKPINYDPFATIDDSSCVYKMTYVPDDDFENLLESFGFGDGRE